MNCFTGISMPLLLCQYSFKKQTIVFFSATATPAKNYDIFDISLECLPFLQKILLKALPPIISPALEAREEISETLSALLIGSTMLPLPWPAPLPTQLFLISVASLH